ncbi:hypothetical protein H312_03156, partial [Anncaliia algerae PRA339]
GEISILDYYGGKLIYLIHILSVFLKIFCSENYKILYLIIPVFSLIRRIMERKKNKVISIQIIWYCQLILLKFEEFPFKYFNTPTILEADLKKLYENEELNETVAVINFFIQENFILMWHFKPIQRIFGNL